MKKFIMWLFNVQPEIKYVEKEKIIEKEKELPKGSILIVADKIIVGDVELGVE